LFLLPSIPCTEIGPLPFEWECWNIQTIIPLWFLANKPVVEKIDLGHLLHGMCRFVYVERAKRVDLSRTVREMRATSCCIVNDPFSQEYPLHRLIAVHWVATSYRIAETLLVQVLVKRDDFIWNIPLFEKQANIFTRGLNL
jgi:hypothetical protein